MRAPDCFIQCSIIISVLLFSSGLVMGRPVDPGMEILRLPKATDFQKSEIKRLQRIREILLDAVETVAKALKGAEIEFKSLPQNAAQEEEKFSSLQKILKSGLDVVELMVQVLKGIRNFAPPDFYVNVRPELRIKPIHEPDPPYDRVRDPIVNHIDVRVPMRV